MMMDNEEYTDYEHSSEQTPEDVQDTASQAQPETQAEPQSETYQQSASYQQTDSGRSSSPYANSPYSWNPAPQAPKKKSSGKAGKAVTAAVLAAVLVGGSVAGTAAVVNHSWEQKSSQMESSFNTKLSALQKQLDTVGSGNGVSVSGTTVSTDGLTPGQVYSENVKSVVAISNESTTNYFGQVSETASSGSGFILTEDGYVVTNYHVIENATKLTVLTHDGTEYDAKVVGYDATNDVALLKVEATGLPAVTVGSSDDLIVGDMVEAIGNPLGELTSTMTVGYVSAKSRDVTANGNTINMLQTDAAINPGNSGGPLFNMKGEVVGITTAKYSGTTSSGATIEGIGFAIPIDDVIDMIQDLKDYGYVTGAYLGITVRTMDKDTASAYNLPTGSYVDTVTDGSCAQKAGLQPKDIIVGLGDYTVTSNTDLTRALRKYKAGETVELRVYRSGKELTLNVTLDEKPNTTTTDDSTTPTGQGELPSNGDYEEWFKYFFGNQGGNGGNNG